MVYPIARYFIPPFMLRYVKDIRGLDNLPKDSAFILAPNHQSFFDDILIPSIVSPRLNKKVHFYVNHRYFRNFFLRKFLYWGGSIPVEVRDKNNKTQSTINKEAFKKAIAYLKRKEIVGVFPEGHRSKDGKLQKGKIGAAKLALTAKVPVLPVGINGTYRILPKGAIWLKNAKCTLKFGRPIVFEKYYGKQNNKAVLEKVTGIIMKEISKLI